MNYDKRLIFKKFLRLNLKLWFEVIEYMFILLMLIFIFQIHDKKTITIRIVPYRIISELESESGVTHISHFFVSEFHAYVKYVASKHSV